MLQETEDLVKLQAKDWDPILEWFNQKFEVDIKPCPGLLGADIPAPAQDTIRRYLLSYDMWAANGEGAKVASGRTCVMLVSSVHKETPEIYFIPYTHMLNFNQSTVFFFVILEQITSKF